MISFDFVKHNSEVEYKFFVAVCMLNGEVTH